MFNIGNYKVRFNHVSRDFLVLNNKQLKQVCGVTTCKILDCETGEFKYGATIICENGNNNSKNNRRKRTLSATLQQLFPTNTDNQSKNYWNKKARTLFWQTYAEKRGGLEDRLPKTEEKEEMVDVIS